MQYLVISIISICVVLYVDKFLNRVKGVRFYTSIRYKFNIINIIFVSIFFASFMLLVSILLENVGFLEISRGEFNVSVIPYILYSIIVAPIVEEYFYRYCPYVIINNFRYAYYVLLVSSVVFAYSHTLIVQEQIFVFCMAIILSLLYLKSKNILYPIVSHSMYNLFIQINYYTGFDNLLVISILIVISVSVLFIYNKNKLLSDS